MTLREMRNDYDWRAAFYQAFNQRFNDDNVIGPIADVTEVFAAASGTADELDWVAVVRMKSGKFAKMFAGCDYTGWD